MVDAIQGFLNSLFGGLPNIIAAILLLALALFVAWLVKTIVVKGGKKIGLEKYTEKWGIGEGEGGKGSLELIGKIIFVLVFILFLPGILQKLGLEGVATPIVAMTTALVGYLPNILGAILVLVVGMFLAKIIKQVLTTLLKKAKIDNLQAKMGIAQGEDTVTFSTLIGNIVYIFILIPVIIAALQVLNISIISTPAMNMLNSILAIIPSIFVAIILIVIGVAIARIVGKLLADLLSTTGLNGLLNKMLGDKAGKITLSKVIGEFVKYIIILLFAVEAASVVHLDILNTVGLAVIAYLPSVIGAVLILGVGFLLASWVETLILKFASGAKFVAKIVKYAILLLAIFMTLNQLQLASNIVEYAFIGILGALAVAFAISFGIGGRGFAAGVLEKFNKKTEETNAEDQNK
ncbi:MAG: mechanosensitive ion channel [Firmicutes bacterium]|nr:mechanosensitive ion channel [Bacillota bacterium]